MTAVCEACRRYNIASRQSGKTVATYNFYRQHMKDDHDIILPYWDPHAEEE